ncbi:hypothetical protein KIN20_032019 [Parelaphostrongylus tenuis]|uniref:Uncharacterized protein n=1 Tax=Parelaphostrongylus tenuis TaxID=148309 RepID=A0AAD5R6D1_PARTN|nr:hypothetical protein KIN20_032019 [Parelaphostrongylus tenuis]
MSEQTVPRFIPKPTGFSTFSHRLWHIVSLPFRRSVPRLAFVTVVWITTYNVAVRLWKGPDHPINRFQWRRMENAGTLPDELLQKKKTVLDYHKSRFFNQDSAHVSVLAPD